MTLVFLVATPAMHTQVVLVGLSIDYSLHVAHAYYVSPSSKRRGRAKYAVEHMGMSIFSSAITTAGASSFLLMATVAVRRTIVNTLWLVVFSQRQGLSSWLPCFAFAAGACHCGLCHGCHDGAVLAVYHVLLCVAGCHLRATTAAARPRRPLSSPMLQQQEAVPNHQHIVIEFVFVGVAVIIVYCRCVLGECRAVQQGLVARLLAAERTSQALDKASMQLNPTITFFVSDEQHTAECSLPCAQPHPLRSV